jgi:phosphoserine phosphatase
VYDGTVAEHFDEYDRRDRALSLAGERGLTVDQCGAVGDSRSDLPVFAATPMSLALNAGDAARAGATDAIETHDLIEIVPWVEKWESRLG